MLHEPLRAVGRQSTLLHAVQHGGVSCMGVTNPSLALSGHARQPAQTNWQTQTFPKIVPPSPQDFEGQVTLILRLDEGLRVLRTMVFPAQTTLTCMTQPLACMSPYMLPKNAIPKRTVIQNMSKHTVLWQ
jgi:hypothetical protein